MRPVVVLLGIACLAWPAPAVALTDEEIFREFRFNLINPGARSLAMGGAFVSLADDATAAQANPAGLGFLNYQEFFVEHRWVDNESDSTSLTESLSGTSTFGVTGTELDDVGSPSFISFVLPFSRWTLGISRQEVLRTESRTLSRFAITVPGATDAFLVNGTGTLDAKIVNYNGSFGVRFGDRWAIGGSLAYSEIEVDAEVSNVIKDPQQIVADHQILEPTLDLRTSIDDTDEDFSFNVGVIWLPRRDLRVAAVYRKLPKFAVTEVIDPEIPDGDGDGFPDGGIDTLSKRDLFGCDPSLPCAFENQFNPPDSYGIGVSWQAARNLTISQDIERIEYSDQVDGYVAGVNILTAPGARFVVDDEWEARVGAEYVVESRVPVAFRAGLFTEHDSTIKARDTGENAFASPALFRAGDGQVHATVGMGAVWGQNRYKLDVAADIGDTANQYLVSFILWRR